MPKLTKRIIDDLKPAVKPHIEWDQELRGFGVLVLPSGVKSFVLQYRNVSGRSKRLTIGRYGVFTVDEARKVAREALGQVAQGNDPVSERSTHRQEPTVSDLLTRYLADYVKVRNALTTQKAVTIMVEKHIRPHIGALKVKSITRIDVSKLHLAMKDTPRSANYMLSTLSKAFSLAEDWNYRPENSNPCRKVEKYRENHRTRFLNDLEIKRLGDVLIEAETVGIPWQMPKEAVKKSKHTVKLENQRTIFPWQSIAVIRLLLLTGARLSEILSLKWVDVSLPDNTIALPNVKGGSRVPHPIGDATRVLLENLPRVQGSPYVLPRTTNHMLHITIEVMQNAWQRIRWRAGLEDVHLHDLRHTVGTYGAQAGVSMFMVRDLLRHNNISTTSQYANFDANPVRNLSNIIGERVMVGLSGTPKLDKLEE
jgi:integrase